ncbi:MAG TPA: ATP-binding protein [Vicinamibacterales bacterium]|nr:ATP-binding protein [Vicinamibacterales bacterium]
MADQSEPIAAALRLAAIAESSEDAIISKDLNGTVTSWNRGAERIFGYRADEIIGRPITTLIPHEQQDEEIYVLARIRNGQSVDHFETVRRHKSGAIVPVSLTVSPIRAPDGTIVGASKIARDITERRHAEMAIAESEKKRSHLEEQLMALVEGSGMLFESLHPSDVPQAIIRAARRLITADGYAVWRFDQAEGSWDLTASEGLSDEFVQGIVTVYRGRPEGQGPPSMQSIVTEDVASLPELGNRRALYRGEGITSILGVPLALVGVGAGALVLYYRTPHAFDETEIQIARAIGNLSAAAITSAELHDEQRRSREDLTKAYRQARAANRAKDEFLATLSHELRTPLNAVLGWARMLSAGAVAPERFARAIEVIERNANAQLRLVEDMLDLSRIITGKLRLDVQPTRLSDAIAAAIETVMPAATAKEIPIKVETDAGDLVNGDSARLQQVVWNLLSNAVKFTPKGGRVAVTLRSFASSVELEVTDTGEGIEPDILPYVFDRFRQADAGTTRTHMGLGLGLAIVRHIVEMHGGRVSASSEGAGHGATFRLSLPAALLEGERTSSAARRVVNSTSHSLPAALFGMHVLVVDRDSESREALTSLLEGRGLLVDAVSSVDEGLAAIKRVPPDVILSDLGSAAHEYTDLLLATRERLARSGERVPVIVLSAASDTLRQSGVRACLTKPIDPEALFSALERLTAVPVRDDRA